MRVLIKGMILFAVVSFLASCASDVEKPQGKGTASVKIQRDRFAKLPRHFRDSLYPRGPLPATGLRSIDDALARFAPDAVDQLQPYFEKAGVAYPPSEVTLIGLKEERRLEVWARSDNGKFRFIRDYDILAASGHKGPKLRQGDRQVPEGIYRIAHLNPHSHFHLSMKLNYPNEFDRYHASLDGRTRPGNDIFIHGSAVSAGCLAMGDAHIEEIFVLIAHVGEDNTKVVIAPHDPRTRPLEANDPDLPVWTDELYREISDEILAVSDAEPVQVSSNRSVLRSDRRIR